jgi:hypothetical protein
MGTLYERDFYSWALGQARALRLAGSARLNTPATLDWENLAEEIESLGRSQASELESRYYQLLAHLLKWHFQPERRSSSWRGTIVEQRYQLGRLLNGNPGLEPSRSRRFRSAYAGARDLAAAETELPVETFPVDCPWSIDQASDKAFWPD